MDEVKVLFGRKIVPHHMLNYAEQIYDIIVGEIERGRWAVNDRLPGVIHLARELGFGTKTIQTAYDRLKSEGYITTLGYRGTFLKSMHPMRSAPDGGCLGVLLAESQTDEPLILWYQHVILRVARRRNLVVETRVLSGNLPPAAAVQRGGLFSDGIRGVIALNAFRMPVRFEGGAEQHPVVFLCPPYESCSPKVCADVQEAYYDLTARLILGGHRRIVYSEDVVEPDPRQVVLHRQGYLEAMADHGLPVDEAFMASSREVRHHDLASLLEHVRGIKNQVPSRRPTAVVAGSLGRSTFIARTAPLARLEIPGEVSLVSIGSARVYGDRGPQLTGMLPHFDRMVEHCLAMLDEQRRDGRCECSALHVRMHLVPGRTMQSLTGMSDTVASGWEPEDGWMAWGEEQAAGDPQRSAQPGLFT